MTDSSPLSTQPTGPGPDRGRGRQALQKGGIPPLWKRGVRGDFRRGCLLDYRLLNYTSRT